MIRIGLLIPIWLLFLFVAPVFAPADIYRWDTRELFPGTEGIVPR